MVGITYFYYQDGKKQLFTYTHYSFSFDPDIIPDLLIDFHEPNTLFLDIVRVTKHTEYTLFLGGKPVSSVTTTLITIHHPRFVHTREDYEQ